MIFAIVENFFDILACARTLGGEVCAIIFSKIPLSNEHKNEIYLKGADTIYSIVDDKLGEFNGKYYSEALLQLIKIKNPNIIIFPATQNGRELAPQVSTTLNTGLTADCTSLNLIEKNGELKLASIRPTFGGRLMAEILCRTTPQMSTLRPGAYKQIEYNKSPRNFEEFKPDLSNIYSSIEIIEKIILETTSTLSGADIILSGGRGLKTKENFEKLEEIAKRLNVGFGASRGAVEMGIAPKCVQIGQTGVCVSPKLYIAFGISGAIHHLVGIENAQIVVAVNTDKNAPIFSNCDYIINTDAVELINLLHNKLF